MVPWVQINDLVTKIKQNIMTLGGIPGACKKRVHSRPVGKPETLLLTDQQQSLDGVTNDVFENISAPLTAPFDIFETNQSHPKVTEPHAELIASKDSTTTHNDKAPKVES